MSHPLPDHISTESPSSAPASISTSMFTVQSAGGGPGSRVGPGSSVSSYMKRGEAAEDITPPAINDSKVRLLIFKSI